MKNILESFLDALEVRYTRMYADSLYDGHPHRDNMYGLKQMLDVYGVRTLGVYMETKDLAALTYPCVLHTGNGFVIGCDGDEKRIVFWQKGERKEFTHEAFRQVWTGNALVVEDLEEAEEPDFRKHQRDSLLRMAKRYCLLVLWCVAVVSGLVTHIGQISSFHLYFMIWNVMGLCICLLLMQKQVFGESRWGDRVCSLFQHAGCNDILNGAYAKFWGISWSEIGTGYFMANLLLLPLYPSAMGMLCVVNWLAMCYGLWSIYYQWRVAKRWCLLCVGVQVVVWGMGVTAACCMRDIPLSAAAGLCTAIVIVACMMAVHQYAVLFQLDKECVSTVRQYRTLKCNHVVAKALVENSAYYEVSDADSSIIFGNKESQLRITILGNPHCNPCARLHWRVEELLRLYGSDICVQYIFTVFNEALEDSCRYLISCYDQDHPETTRRVYAEWYAGGRGRYASIVKEREESIHTVEVEQEWQRHSRWCKNTGFTATPTILVNGYLLPREYDIEDLAMLVNCQIEYPRKNIVHDINGRSTTPLGAESLFAEETV